MAGSSDPRRPGHNARLRVGVDVLPWGSRRGRGRFVRNIVRRLVELDGETTFVLVHPQGAEWAEELPADAEHLAVRLATASRSAPRSFGELARLARAVRSSRVDVLLFPAHCGWFPLAGAPSVVGVHHVIGRDLTRLLFARRRDRARWEAKERMAIRRARSVFAVSAVVRARLTEQFGIPPEAVQVVRLAADPVFTPREHRELQRRLEAYGVEPGAYLVNTGGISPWKGLDTLVDAYAALRDARGTVPPLILVGELDGIGSALVQTLRGRVEDAGLGGVIRFAGGMGDDDLACLYAGALAAVSASRYEGFGLPPVEAAACGTPSVLSDIPAHRETLDGAAVFFPTGSTSALQAALEGLLDDPARREELARRAAGAAARLSWEDAARRVRSAIDTALSRSAGPA